MLVFSGPAPGQLVMMRDPNVLAGRLRFLQVNGFPDSAVSGIVITAASLTENEVYQANMSLDKFLYVFPFGSQGRVTFSGFAAAVGCNGGQSGTGFDSLVAYYKANKMSQRGSEVEVIMGKTAFRGLLTDLQTNSSDGNSWLTQFTMGMLVIPERPASGRSNRVLDLGYVTIFR